MSYYLGDYYLGDYYLGDRPRRRTTKRKTGTRRGKARRAGVRGPRRAKRRGAEHPFARKMRLARAKHRRGA